MTILLDEDNAIADRIIVVEQIQLPISFILLAKDYIFFTLEVAMLLGDWLRKLNEVLRMNE
jgi:hypothetical protein